MNNLYIYYKFLYIYCYKIFVRYCRLICVLKKWVNYFMLYLYFCVDIDNIIIVFRINIVDMYWFFIFSVFSKGKIKKIFIFDICIILIFCYLSDVFFIMMEI